MSQLFIVVRVWAQRDGGKCMTYLVYFRLVFQDNKSAHIIHPRIENCHKIPIKGEIISAAVGWEHLYFLLNNGTIVGVNNEAVGDNSKFYQITYQVESTNGDNTIKLVHLAAGELHLIGCKENSTAGILSHPRGDNSVSKSESRPDNQRSHIREDCDTISEPRTDNSLLMLWEPFDVPASVTQVSCGKEHVVMLTDVGQVFTYGLGSRGQLGHNTTENCESPCLIQQLDGLKMRSVAAGGWHSIALSDIGDVYVWGWNESGQLGLPSKSVYENNMKDKRLLDDPSNRDQTDEFGDRGCVNFVTEPCLVDLPDDVNGVDVGCGSRHSAIVTDTGLLLTTGWNDYGQLGQGDTIGRDTFTMVTSLHERHLVVDTVTCGYWSTLVRTSCIKDL